MTRLIKILLIFSIIGSNCFADTLPGAILISKGTPSPYDGVLLTKPQAKIIYGDLQHADQLQLLNKSLEDSIQLYQDNEVVYLKEITEVRDQNVILQSAVEAAQSNGFWTKALWFGIGFALAGLTVHAIDKH